MRTPRTPVLCGVCNRSLPARVPHAHDAWRGYLCKRHESSLKSSRVKRRKVVHENTRAVPVAAVAKVVGYYELFPR